MAPSTNRTVIGFDLGHGETAVATADRDASDAAKVLDLPGASRRQHVSAVALDDDERVVIGEEAVRMPEPLVLWLGFKRPSLTDPQVRRPMQLLVQRIVADLESQGTIADRGAVHWVFGAPSGWEPDHYREYEKLLAEVGLQDAAVIPESRAALLYAVDSGEVQRSTVAQRVLIVDIGSSTTDYTVVDGLAALPLDHGNVDLGACLIDHEIMRRAVDRHPQREDIEALLAVHPHSARQVELACREAKEKFFRTSPAELQKLNRGIGVLYPLEFRTGEEFHLDTRLTMADMDAVLDAPQSGLAGRSWREAFRDDVEKAVANAGGRVDLLLLTGGPSRMQFVVEVCREQRGVARVVLGNEPEVAIARGLALAGRTSLRATGLRQDMTSVQKRIKPLVEKRIPELAQAIGAAVADSMTERHVIPAFRAWRNGGIPTLAAMLERVVTGVKSDLDDDNGKQVTQITIRWQNEVREELERMTRPVCNRWHIPADALKLPDVEVRADRRDVEVDVDVRGFADVLDNTATALNVAIMAIVSATLFGAGTAVIASTGPFGVVVAFAVGMWVLQAGKDEVMAKIQTINIWGPLRKIKSEDSIVKDLRAGAATKEAELAVKLSAEFEGEFAKRLVGQVTHSIAAQLDAQAEGAELLIR